MHGRDDGGGRAVRLFSAAQNADVTAFERQHCGVRGDVRAAFVDDRHDAHRDSGLADYKSVWPSHLSQNFTDRVRKLRDLPHAVRHGGNASLCQAQTVEHDIGNDALRRVQILRVRGKNGVRILYNCIGHLVNGLIFFFTAEPCQLRAGGFGLLQKRLCCHLSALFPKNLVPMDLPSSSA